MIKKSLMCISAATLVVLASSAVAQANPATPMPAIESAAVQLCGAINANPSEGGVINGFDAMFGRGFDDMDGALVMITAIHHACPQHQELIMNVMNPIAAEELCTEPL